MAKKSIGSGDLPRVIERVLTLGGHRFMARMQREHLSGPTGPDSLSVRTGALRRSLFSTVARHGANAVSLLCSIGSNAPYARVHEYGATIVPRSAKYLAIPLAAAKTAAGVSRWSSPRDFPGELTFIKSKLGNKLLVKFVGKKKNKRMIPMFVLKDSVTIPPRLNFENTFNQEADRITQEIRLAAKTIKIQARRGQGR